MSQAAADWLRPDWDAPGVGAWMTTRSGGVSVAPFDTLNLRDVIGDDPAAVAINRRRVADACGGAVPVYLHQVHGTAVVRLAATDAVPTADSCITTEPDIACAVQVADCLPILFAAPGARAVGAAHAGWRGLAAGVVESTLAALCTAARCTPAEVSAWLGPSIGPKAFEVGPDVLDAFRGAAAGRFVPHGPGKWLADLPALARDRLVAAGVSRIHGGTWCTVSDPSRFFSYRRDRVTGRMAALVWIDGRP